METLSKRSGYIKVADQFMLDELLSSIFKNRMLYIHIIELERILNRLRRKNYISEAQRTYLTDLYVKVVLNNYYFKKSKIKKVKEPEYKHPGMQLYHALNSQKCKKLN